MSTGSAPSRTRPGGVIAVWAIAAVLGVLVGVFVPEGERAGWVAIALAGCMVASFVVQLAAATPRGFIARVGASMLGALVILAAISAVFGLVALIPG